MKTGRKTARFHMPVRGTWERRDRHSTERASRREDTGRLPGVTGTEGVLTIWRVEVHGAGGQFKQTVLSIGISGAGDRLPQLEALLARLPEIERSDDALPLPDRIRRVLPEMVRRELHHRGLLGEDSSVAVRLLAWMQLG